MFPKTKFKASKIVTAAVFHLLQQAKIYFTLIRMVEKLLNFHTLDYHSKKKSQLGCPSL